MVVAFLLVLGVCARAQTLRVAAAADLQFAMNKLGSQFANPEHAPYGRAAREALQKAGVYEQVKSKLVYGENISQAAQFAQFGSAQAGMIARSLRFAESTKGGEVWEIPAKFYSPLLQEAVIAHASSNKIAAKAFLKSDEGRKILSKYGLKAPESMTKP